MSFESELKGGQFTAKEKLLKIADLLERSGIDAEEIGRIERVNVYQGSIKNGDGFYARLCFLC